MAETAKLAHACVMVRDESAQQDAPIPAMQSEYSIEDYRRRTRELAALYASAGDLSSMRHVDQVLAAIVCRGRQLLATDMAYLMLIDPQRHDTFMRVTVGTQTPTFMSIRLAYGEGIGGLVAETGAPQWTAHFEADPRFATSVAPIVRAEGIVAILAVPLTVAGQVIGVLFASDRHQRDFAHDEVALLASLADHAAIALENARLFEESERALQKLHIANSRVESYYKRLERAADMHQNLTELVATGASLDELAAVVSDGLVGRAAVVDGKGLPLTGFADALDPAEIQQLIAAAEVHGGKGQDLVSASGEALTLAPIRTKAAHLGFLIFAGKPLDPSDVRALERAAMVTALLLLDVRAHDEARGRVMTELFSELADPTIRGDAGVRERARIVGLRLADGPYVVFAAIEAGSQDTSGLRAQLVTMAQSQGGLSGSVAGQAVLILPGRNPAAAASDLSRILTKALGAAVTVGAAGPCPTLIDAAASNMRAINCAKVLVTVGRIGQGATAEQLGVYTLLFSDVARNQIEAFVSETLAPVLEYDSRRDADLIRTLEVYYETGGQKGRIAELLFVHVNTLYQRFERLDSLLGDSWRRGDGALQAHLALRLARMLEQTM